MKQAKQRSSSPLLSETNTVPDLVESSSDSEEQVMDRAVPVERTLRELAEPYLNQQPLCIQFILLMKNNYQVVRVQEPVDETDAYFLLNTFPSADVV